MKMQTILTAALLLAGAVSVRAQEAAAPVQRDTNLTVASGQDLATRIRMPQERFASSLLITEFNLLVPVSGTATNSADGGFTIGPELGWMQRIGSRDALALTAFGVVGSDDPRLGAKLRYRRWLSRQFSVDIGLGKVLTEDSPYRGGEYVSSLGVSWNDRLHFVVQYENYRFTEVRFVPTGLYQWDTTTETHRASNLYAGFKFGREAGVIATTAAVIGLVVFLSTFELGPIM